jgi:hypothetical protein
MALWPSNYTENRTGSYDACSNLDNCHCSRPIHVSLELVSELSKAILVDVPRQATQILTQVPADCSQSDRIDSCTAAVGAELLQL